LVGSDQKSDKKPGNRPPGQFFFGETDFSCGASDLTSDLKLLAQKTLPTQIIKKSSSSIILHHPSSSSTILHHPPPSSIILHHPPSSFPSFFINAIVSVSIIVRRARSNVSFWLVNISSF
jgi:hypothetical protein